MTIEEIAQRLAELCEQIAETPREKLPLSGAFFQARRCVDKIGLDLDRVRDYHQRARSMSAWKEQG